jgi:hypothetical protein
MCIKHSNADMATQRPTVKARAHHGTSSLDISIPADVVKNNNVRPGDVFEVTTISNLNEFRIIYKRVYSQPKA